MSTELRIFLYVNGKPFTYVQTTVPRGDINAHYGATGNHGYSKVLQLNDGANSVCAYAINVGAGSNTKLGCGSFPLSGTPLGGISAATQKGLTTTVTGWAFDYDAPDSGSLVRAYVNGRYAAGAMTTVTRSDINAAFHGSGTHGYSIPVTLPTGLQFHLPVRAEPRSGQHRQARLRVPAGVASAHRGVGSAGGARQLGHGERLGARFRCAQYLGRIPAGPERAPCLGVRRRFRAAMWIRSMPSRVSTGSASRWLWLPVPTGSAPGGSTPDRAATPRLAAAP